MERNYIKEEQMRLFKNLYKDRYCGFIIQLKGWFGKIKHTKVMDAKDASHDLPIFGEHDAAFLFKIRMDGGFNKSKLKTK